MVKRCVPELENFASDVPKLPVMLFESLFKPLLKQNSIAMADFVWFVEEEKEDLFDVSNQYKIAALTLNFFLSESNKAPEMLKQEFNKAHAASFDFLGGVLDDTDKEDLREHFIEDNVPMEQNRTLICSVLGLE